MSTDYRLRRATSSDLATIVDFTLEEAREAEGLKVDADAVRRGIRAGLEDPALATYWVAEASDEEVVASTSAVREWSNFNCGYYWWVQSIFIVPEHRGRGLVGLLLDMVAEQAQAAGAIDLRLYVHGSNSRALEAYRR
ncbi:MAG: GNAT family N-acetyltransferase, partial [Deltaproteobacteria bacterium]|nr:GNAT family N-acetyltransferase [Deltaproteobacteria bacterium]